MPSHLDPQHPAPRERVRSRLSAGAQSVVDGASSTVAAAIAVGVVAGWVLVGAFGGFTSGWLAILYTTSSAITLIMVFFIQHTTGRQLRAMSLKLDELVRTHPDADDELIGAEQRPLHEQDRLEQHRRAGRTLA